MDIDKFKIYLQERCSPKGVYHKMSVFKQILNEAYYNGFLQNKIHFPRLENPMGEIEYLEREEQEIILSVIPQEHKPIFIFMMEYGCRPSEARALMKDCIRNSRVTVKMAFSDDTLNESTKTGSKGVRTFDITPRFRDVLNNMPKSLSLLFLQGRTGIFTTVRIYLKYGRRHSKRRDSISRCIMPLDIL